MDVAAIQQRMQQAFGAAVGPVEAGRLESWIEVDPDEIDAVGELLKSDSDLRFDDPIDAATGPRAVVARTSSTVEHPSATASPGSRVWSHSSSGSSTRSESVRRSTGMRSSQRWNTGAQW